jgi:hypothetical protein
MKANTTTALGRTAGKTIEKTYRIVTELGKLIFVRGRGTDEEEAYIDALAESSDALDSPIAEFSVCHPVHSLLASVCGHTVIDRELV